MIDWDGYRLPPGAGPLDRATLVMWKFWRRTVRPTAGLAIRIAAPIGLLAAVAMGIGSAAFFGGHAIAALAIVIAAVVGAVAGWPRGPRPQRLPASPLAGLIAIPLALLFVGLGGIGFGLVTAFVLVPAANHGLPVLAALSVATVVVVWQIRRWRAREDARYPARPVA